MNQLITARQTEKSFTAPLLESAPVAKKADDTITVIKQLLAQRLAAKTAVVAAPAPTLMYQMPPAGAMPMMQYPTFQMPAPVSVVQAPQKSTELVDLSKQDLIKILLTQLAKPDLEA